MIAPQSSDRSRITDPNYMDDTKAKCSVYKKDWISFKERWTGSEAGKITHVCSGKIWIEPNKDML